MEKQNLRNSLNPKKTATKQGRQSNLLTTKLDITKMMAKYRQRNEIQISLKKTKPIKK